jgi:hypothetical protein
VGTGDDEHCHGALDRVARVAQGAPRRERQEPRRGRRIEQERGGAICQHLRPRPRRLRLLDESPYPREGGVLPHRVDAHAQRGIGRHRARHDAIADGACDRARFARDHALVERGHAVDHDAVGGHAPAGAHEHDVAAREIRGRDPLDAGVGDTLGLVGEELGQRLERAAGLSDRLHLLPVPEQHDRDERGELPPEVEPKGAELRDGARDEGHRDREGDQKHHSRASRPRLVDTAGEERSAAVEEDHGAEHGGDPRASREAHRPVVEQHLHHVAEVDDWDREQKREPEALTEHGGVIAVTAVARVMVMARGSTLRGRAAPLLYGMGCMRHGS